MIAPLPAGNLSAVFNQARAALKLGTRSRTARDRFLHSPPVADARLRREGFDSDREDLIERVLDGVRAAGRVIARSAPDGALFEVDGVAAAVLPGLPDQAVMNAVNYTDADALEYRLHEVAAAYRWAGVRSWMVRVPIADRRARRALKAAGHSLAASPMAMLLPLEEVDRPDEGKLERWTAAGDPAVMATICDEAFHFRGAWSHVYAQMSQGSGRVYIASQDGEPASCLLGHDVDGNFAIAAVATRERFRGRALARHLLGHALADAAERGAASATLVATPEGRPGYRRLGFHDMGPLEQWERRS